MLAMKRWMIGLAALLVVALVATFATAGPIRAAARTVVRAPARTAVVVTPPYRTYYYGPVRPYVAPYRTYYAPAYPYRTYYAPYRDPYYYRYDNRPYYYRGPYVYPR
jgi:hypothetical protein